MGDAYEWILFGGGLVTILMLSELEDDFSPEIWDAVGEQTLPVHPTRRYRTREISQVTTHYVHHSATNGQNTIDYAMYHVNSKGWPGIGYHQVIEPSGLLVITNYPETVSYHTSGKNTVGIATCLSGNFMTKDPTPEQLKTLMWVNKTLYQKLPNLIETKGHRDDGNTSCPGDRLYHIIKQL